MLHEVFFKFEIALFRVAGFQRTESNTLKSKVRESKSSLKQETVKFTSYALGSYCAFFMYNYFKPLTTPTVNSVRDVRCLSFSSAVVS